MPESVLRREPQAGSRGGGGGQWEGAEAALMPLFWTTLGEQQCRLLCASALLPVCRRNVCVCICVCAHVCSIVARLNLQVLESDWQ